VIDAFKISVSTGSHVPQKDARSHSSYGSDLRTNILVDSRTGGCKNVANKAIGRAMNYPVIMSVDSSAVFTRFLAIGKCFRSGDWRWALSVTVKLGGKPCVRRLRREGTGGCQEEGEEYESHVRKVASLMMLVVETLLYFDNKFLQSCEKRIQCHGSNRQDDNGGALSSLSSFRTYVQHAFWRYL
jgi:hypothetical protein